MAGTKPRAESGWMAVKTLGSRRSHAGLAPGICLADGGLVADSGALCSWELENECPHWQPAVGCMGVLAPSSSGVTHSRDLLFHLVHVIGDAGWQMVCAWEFSGLWGLGKSRRLAHSEECGVQEMAVLRGVSSPHPSCSGYKAISH